MKTIEQQNVMIAEFMGYIDNGCSEEGYLIHPTTNHDIDINSLKYHTSWDWLMPVINKIHSLDEFYKYKDNSGQFGRDEIVNTKYIEVTHSNVCQFIESYNAIK